MENNKMTLFALTEQMARIEAVLEENGGELTPELEAEWTETGESLSRKIDNYNALMQKLKAYSENIKAEQDRLAALKKTADNSLKRLKAHILDVMVFNGMKAIEGNLCKVTISSSTATEVDEETVLAPYRDAIEALQAKLPAYVTLEPKISKTDIKAASAELPEGTSLPGVTFVTNKSLRVK